MHALHSFRPRFSVTALLMTSWLTVWLLSRPASAQVIPNVEGVDCETSPEAPECAPDQRLSLDAARPSRRFASYSDLVTLVRARVSLGLVLAPFPEGGLSRLRFEAELVTRWRSPRGTQGVARVGVTLLGSGLDGLFLAAAVGYEARVQPGGRVSLGGELGYARHFASLFVSIAAGASVEVWSRSPSHRVAPTVRLLLGHAFY